jgi:hypothetical protein
VKISELVVAALGTPNSSDTELQYDVSRLTASGSVMAYTANQWDLADAAAVSSAASMPAR